ncbi:Uncharacterized protein GBIM_04513 [Gryllus bimaculatus]|nr:Uncharacterized protein GBIM_04513 [Gryllus bimaculatus]
MFFLAQAHTGRAFLNVASRRVAAISQRFQSDPRQPARSCSERRSPSGPRGKLRRSAARARGVRGRGRSPLVRARWRRGAAEAAGARGPPSSPRSAHPGARRDALHADGRPTTCDCEPRNTTDDVRRPAHEREPIRGMEHRRAARPPAPALLVVMLVITALVTAPAAAAVRKKGPGGASAGPAAPLLPPVEEVSARATAWANATCGADGPQRFCRPAGLGGGGAGRGRRRRRRSNATCVATAPGRRRGAPPRPRRCSAQAGGGPPALWQSPSLAEGEHFERVTFTLDLRRSSTYINSSTTTKIFIVLNSLL